MMRRVGQRNKGCPREFRALVRKIGAIVRAPAFFPPQGAACDQGGDLVHVAKFRSREGWRGGGRPLRSIQCCDGGFETRAIANDPAALPREFANFPLTAIRNE